MNTEYEQLQNTFSSISTHDLQWIYDNLNIDNETNQYQGGYTPISQYSGKEILDSNIDFIFENIGLDFSKNEEEYFTYRDYDCNGNTVRKPKTIFSFIDFSKKVKDRYKETKINYYVLKGLKSRYDYNKEKTEYKTNPIWDNSRANTIAAGNLFFFAHDNKQNNFIAEMHYVESADNNQPRRKWWSKANRNVLTLSEKFVSLPLAVVKEWIVSGTDNRKMSPKNRLQGTSTAKFNKHLKFALHLELAKRNGSLQELEAKIWNVQENPIDESIFNVVTTVANSINTLVNGTKIFSNQIHNASVSLQILLDQTSDQRMILCADTQSGKSGSSELLSHSIRPVLLLKNLISADDKIGCINIQHISDSALKDQNLDDRLICSRFGTFHPYEDNIYKSIVDYNILMTYDMLSGGAANRIIKDAERLINEFKCKKIIIISDEIQSAMTYGQQISKVYDNLQLNSDQNNIFTFGTSATPDRYHKQTYDKKPITLYWGENGENYYGIQDMVNDSKLHNLGNISDELYEAHILKYLIPNKYIFVRDYGAKTKFWNTFAQKYNIKIKPFNCAEGNISDLNKQLKQPPAFYDVTNMILMVKMAARAGNTINTLEHVSVMFDSFSGDEPIIQSFPGRCSGNQPNRKAFCPDIFTNLPKVQQYLVDRETIRNGQLPEVKKTQSGKRAKIGQPPEYKCISVQSSEYKDHVVFVKSEFGEDFMVNHCDEQKKNLAKAALSMKHEFPFRALGLKNKVGPWENYNEDIKKLIVRYPELLNQDYVLIAKNIIKISSRKLGNTVLQKTQK